MTTNAELEREVMVSKPGWGPSVVRVPDEDWSRNPVEEAALKYDKHGGNVFGSTWEPTVAQALSVFDTDKILIDYSCGTGQFTERLLRNHNGRARVLNVDVSPRYMRLAAERFKYDDRVALRLLNKSNDALGFQSIDEVADGLIPNSGADILTSTNAIHLYTGLPEALESWHRVMRSGGLVLISTGDMSNPKRTLSDWRLHDTVATVNEIALDVVRTDSRFEQYRNKAEDEDLLNSYASLRDYVYPTIKPIDLYLDSLSDAGLKPIHHFEVPVNITVRDLIDALSPYHEVILGWVGGSRKVEGRSPTKRALEDRSFLIRHCAETLYDGRGHFQCAWTYITCRSQ